MKMTYFGYNAFMVESREKTIILDPGRDLCWRRLNSLIPRSLWARADLILVTHGDADHAEYVADVARASGAPIVSGPALLGRWRRQGLAAVSVEPGQTIRSAGVPVQGVSTQHGGISGRLFGCTFIFKPTFVGVGAVGFIFTLDHCRVLNLGDTLLIEDTWWGLCPDVLMVPICGVMTMGVDEALKAVEGIEPKVVIPMHFNWHILFYRHMVNVKRFANGVRRLGAMCLVLERGESTEMFTTPSPKRQKGIRSF